MTVNTFSGVTIVLKLDTLNLINTLMTVNNFSGVTIVLKLDTLNLIKSIIDCEYLLWGNYTNKT